MILGFFLAVPVTWKRSVAALRAGGASLFMDDKISACWYLELPRICIGIWCVGMNLMVTPAHRSSFLKSHCALPNLS